MTIEDFAKHAIAALLAGDEDRFAEEAFAALEHVAAIERVDAVEAVGLCFLGSLPNEVLDLLDAYVGPRTEAMLDELLAGTLDLEE